METRYAKCFRDCIEVYNMEYECALKCLIEESLSMLNFSDGVRSAKENSPQSYVFHSVSVGTLSLAICEEIAKDKRGKRTIENLGNLYQTDYRRLCYYSGFFHDWMKLYSKKEEGVFKVPIEAKQKAKELAKNTNIPNSDLLIDYIADFAEGHLQNNVEMPLWASVKVADMLMISDIRSVSDTFKYANSLNYNEALKILEDYNVYFSYIKSSPRLFTLLVSEEIINKIEGKPLISYKDGIIYLSRNKKSIKLDDIYKIFEEKLHSDEAVEEAIERIKQCIESRRGDWEALNLGKFKEVLYKENGKIKQTNELLPPGKKDKPICKPFTDFVSYLSPEETIKIAAKIIEELEDDIPYGVIAYFVSKFAPDKRPDKDYIKKYLGIKESSFRYLEQIKDPKPYLDKIIEAVKEYSKNKRSYTLMEFVKKSFSGDIDIEDGLKEEIEEKPKNYCIVCGMPIYEPTVRFAQYAATIGGTGEIWLPTEIGLEKIDDIKSEQAICPICYYEAEQMKKAFKPPFVIVSFYPGIPVDLLSLLRFKYEKVQGFNYADIANDESFYKVYENSGGYVEPREARLEIKVDYLGAKVVIPAGALIPFKEKATTRLTKNLLNHILYYAPFISISFLASPLFISSNIYDFPLSTGNIDISSDINYAWFKVDDNYKKFLLLFSYSAKYKVLLDRYRRKEEMENYLNSLINDMELFSSVDKSLTIIAMGIAVDEDLAENLKEYIPFLTFVLRKESEMGETLSKSTDTIAEILNRVIRERSPSKHDVVGFLRDGIDEFFKSSMLGKEDRVNIASSRALNTLVTKYSLSDEDMKEVFSSLKEIFNKLYDIEKESNRSLAIAISTDLVNYLYLSFISKR